MMTRIVAGRVSRIDVAARRIRLGNMTFVVSRTVELSVREGTSVTAIVHETADREPIIVGLRVNITPYDLPKAS